MAEFNVLKEPWIPVISADGSIRELGVREALCCAHELKEVVCENPLETYAVQRFLIAFLMDAYRLEHAGDRKKLFRSGRFDPAVIDGYIDLCKGEGVTFDLFDEKRPFYQATLNEQYDSDDRIKPVATLFHASPSGNNPIHFEHQLASDSCCTIPQAFRALLSMQTFTPKGGRGYYRSLNGDPCWYVLLKGNNLFETLCLSMLSIGECRGIEFDKVLPAWRNASEEPPGTLRADVSMLEGLTFRPRRITLIKDPDDAIRKLFFQPGERFEMNERWRDPHVTYVLTKKGDYAPITPELHRMPWRDVGAFAFSRENGYSKPATILRHSENILSRSDPRIIMLFGLATSDAKLEDWFSDCISVPGEILFNVYKAESLRAAMQRVEQVAKLVYTTLKAISNATERSKDGKKKDPSAANEAQTQFFAEMHTAVFSEYMPVLAKVDDELPDWEREPDEIINRLAVSAARKIVYEYAKSLGSTARCMEEQAEQLKWFRIDLIKITEERTVTE